MPKLKHKQRFLQYVEEEVDFLEELTEEEREAQMYIQSAYAEGFIRDEEFTNKFRKGEE